MEILKNKVEAYMAEKEARIYTAGSLRKAVMGLLPAVSAEAFGVEPQIAQFLNGLAQRPEKEVRKMPPCSLLRPILGGDPVISTSGCLIRREKDSERTKNSRRLMRMLGRRDWMERRKYIEEKRRGVILALEKAMGARTPVRTVTAKKKTASDITETEISSSSVRVKRLPAVPAITRQHMEVAPVQLRSRVFKEGLLTRSEQLGSE